MQRTSRGFTLVELLVVIAIISVLAALLLPSLAGAMYQAKVTSCINTHRMTGVSLLSYASEANGWYPYRSACWSNPTGASAISAPPNAIKFGWPSYFMDDRAAMQMCLDIDTLPFCALAPAKPYQDSGWYQTVQSYILSKTYAAIAYLPMDIYAGCSATETGSTAVVPNRNNSMLRVGGMHRWPTWGKKSRILAGDTYRPCNNYTTSGHQDAQGLLTNASYSSGNNRWQCLWQNFPNASHGPTDRTFVYDDGHARVFTDIVPKTSLDETSTDPRMQVVMFGAGNRTCLPKE